MTPRTIVTRQSPDEIGPYTLGVDINDVAFCSAGGRVLTLMLRGASSPTAVTFPNKEQAAEIADLIVRGMLRGPA